MPVTIPSERNFAIYHRSLSEGCSRTQVASEFGISPTRVQQVVQQVQGWVAQHGCREFAGLAGSRLHLAALRITLERLAHTRHAIRQQWEETKHQEVVVRTLGAQRDTTIRPAYRALTLMRECSRLAFDELKITRELAAFEDKLLSEGTLLPSEIDWDNLELPADAEELEEDATLDSPPAPPASPVPDDGDADLADLSPEELYQRLQQLDRSANWGLAPALESEFAAANGARLYSPVGDCMKSPQKQDAADFEAILRQPASTSADSTYDAMQERKSKHRKRRRK